MSLAEFRSKLHLARYGEKDQVWFPKWLGRYAAGKQLTAGLLPVTEALVIETKQILGRLTAAEKDSGGHSCSRKELAI